MTMLVSTGTEFSNARTSSDRATPTDMSCDAVPLELNDAIKEAIGTAFESLNFVTVAYNGDDGWPHVSRRGSTQVFGPQQMAIWVRKRTGVGQGRGDAARGHPLLPRCDRAGRRLDVLRSRSRVDRSRCCRPGVRGEPRSPSRRRTQTAGASP
jgi:hypothetical protein